MTFLSRLRLICVCSTAVFHLFSFFWICSSSACSNVYLWIVDTGTLRFLHPPIHFGIQLRAVFHRPQKQSTLSSPLVRLCFWIYHTLTALLLSYSGAFVLSHIQMTAFVADNMGWCSVGRQSCDDAKRGVDNKFYVVLSESAWTAIIKPSNTSKCTYIYVYVSMYVCVHIQLVFLVKFDFWTNKAQLSGPSKILVCSLLKL